MENPYWKPDGMDNLHSPGHSEVKKVFSARRIVRFEWSFDPFSQFLPRVVRYSPSVKCFKRKWSLGMLKSRHITHSVYLRREPSPPGITGSVRFTIGWKKEDGGESDIVHDQTYPKDSDTWKVDFGRVIHEKRVTLTCTLWKVDSPPAPDISILREHYKNLLLSGDGHDVLIKVGVKQFRAHKNILKVRSPVFAAMFTTKMTESVEDSVTIKDCDADAFGEFLQFVYTGKVDMTSVGRALVPYKAGDKYDFPSPKEMCVEFLKNSFTTTTVSDVVRMAARHDEEELLQEAIVYFANNLEEVMLAVEWQRFLEANPVQANAMNLKAVQCLRTQLGKKSLAGDRRRRTIGAVA